MFTSLLYIPLSLFLGFAMKTADLLDEHGLKWFKGSNILFGILWGVTGAALLFVQKELAMFWLATFFTYIIKAQIDYFNHGIAETIILFAFIFNVNRIEFISSYFLYFYIAIALTGLINKYIIEKYNIQNKFVILFKLRLHYLSIVVLFGLVTGYWTVFISRLIFWITYEATTEFGQKIIARQQSDLMKQIT